MQVRADKQGNAVGSEIVLDNSKVVNTDKRREQEVYMRTRCARCEGGRRV